jgi:hypothetical protein
MPGSVPESYDRAFERLAPQYGAVADMQSKKAALDLQSRGNGRRIGNGRVAPQKDGCDGAQHARDCSRMG